jgi:uncharacterized SAM-binding protein YcdF (DUF218 family)
MRKVALFRQRQVWIPTLYGWLLFLLVSFASAMLLRSSWYAFLAPNDPGGANILVVEGWLAPEELDQAIEVFRKGKYERIVTTGGPMLGWPGLNHAKVAADYFVNHGIKREDIAFAPAPKSPLERTFLSAVVFRKYAQQSGIKLEAIDVFSTGPHARRSRLLFQMALRDKVKVGIFAARPEGYDPDVWWRTSSGVEQMIFQSFGYVWVKCCFWPDPADSPNELSAVP